MGTGVAGVGERNNNLREKEQCQLVGGPLPLLYFLTVVPPSAHLHHLLHHFPLNHLTNGQATGVNRRVLCPQLRLSLAWESERCSHCCSCPCQCEPHLSIYPRTTSSSLPAQRDMGHPADWSGSHNSSIILGIGMALSQYNIVWSC